MHPGIHRPQDRRRGTDGHQAARRASIVADLHVHTTASDGQDSPAGLVRRARDAGVGFLGIADHDSIAGLAPAEAAASKTRVVIVPCVELSARQGRCDVHVLGYFVDRHDVVLNSYLRRLGSLRTRRAALMVRRLRDCGVDVSLGDVGRVAGRGRVGRAHVARALIDKGHARSMGDAFGRYLGAHASCYVAKPAPTVPEVVRFLRDLGAVPVLAHPAIVGCRIDIDQAMGAGLAGIESVNPEHTRGQMAYWRRRARGLGLVVTGGSDWHGDGQTPHAGAFGQHVVDASVVDELAARRAPRRADVAAPALGPLGA